MLEIITFTYNSCTKEDFQRFEIIFFKNTTLIVTADGQIGLLMVVLHVDSNWVQMQKQCSFKPCLHPTCDVN